MWGYLDGVLSLNTVIWLFPVAFMVHDLEEIILVESFLTRHGERVMRMLPERVRGSFAKRMDMTAAQLAVAVGVMFALVVLATVCGSLASEQGEGSWLLAGALGVYFLHAFTHVGQAVVLRTVTPGAVTSVLVVVPYSLYAYHRLFAAGVLSWEMTLWSLPMGLLLASAVMPAHMLGKRLVPRREV